MLSEKLMTMISGVITFRKMFRRKSSQPSAPSASRMATSGGAGGDDHERYAAEEQDRDQAADDKSERVVDQPVALDRIADLELHHRHAGELGSQSGAGQMFPATPCGPLRSAAQAGPGPVASGSKREHHQGQLAVRRQHFVANDFIRHHALDECLVLVALRQRVGE